MSVVNAVLQSLAALKMDSTALDGPDGKAQPVETESIETAEKLRVFQSLPKLALHLGPEETRKTLVPTLSELVVKAIDAGDDEVLMVIAQKIGGLVELVGGGEHVACLLPIVAEIVVCVEEVIVAQAACDAFVAVLPSLPAASIEEHVVPLLRKLHEEDLFCASRKVLSKMIVACYPLVPANLQSELKYRLIHLSDNDEEVPLVRAAAIQQLVELCKLIGADIKQELASLLLGLVTDSQRMVRAACITPLLELAKLASSQAEFESLVRPCLDKLSEDETRDTRRALATSMADLQQLAVTNGGASRSLHVTMMNLLEDNDVETRRIAATQLRAFCLASLNDILTDFLLPRLREHLCMERDERVRAELVCCAVGLLPSVRRDDCLPLVRHILAFLNDHFNQPKQYVFEHFSKLVALMPANEIQLTLLPSLLRLWQEKSWRVRLGVVQSVPFLFDKVPESCLRELVLPSALAWLRDPTWSVRDCACRSLARLLRVCPAAAKDAIWGTGAAGAASAGSTGSGTSGSGAASGTGGGAATGTAGAVNSGATATAAGAGGGDNAMTSSTASGAGEGAASAVNPGGISIASLTATAAAGGLHALVTDSNYHLRQIFIRAVQTLWSPGIPDEPAYSASGDSSPHICIMSPSLNDLHAYVAANAESSSKVPAPLPSNCTGAPTLPPAMLQTCLQYLVHLLAEDKVPNVRFSAARALYFMSGNCDKTVVAKQIIPVLKTAIDNDTDADVRFYAQETLTAFPAV